MKRIPRVSDHALLRYLERVRGFDLDRFRQEILTPTVKAAIEAGASAVLIDGHRCTVSPAGTITTVFPKPRAYSTSGRTNHNGAQA